MDIAPELYEKLKKTFEEKYGADEGIEKLSKLIGSGKGTYRDADDYAVKVGQILGDTFRENISKATLPDGKMYYNIANRTVAPMFKSNHALVAAKCAEVQKAINSDIGINLKGLLPDLDERYLKDIIDKATDMEDIEKLLDYLTDVAVDFALSAVDDAVRKNADFQSKSGMIAKVYRSFRPGLTNQKAHHENKYWQCPYCKERECSEGVDYEEVSSQGAWIWQRHPGCNCIIEYKQSRGFKQIVPPTRRREVQKNLERAARSGKIYSGARIINPDTDEAREWAKSYYAEIRKKSTDCGKIAKRFGYSEELIKKIKEYAFSDEPRYVNSVTGKMEPFIPDAAMAQSWQRLAEGKEVYEHDKTMLLHEILEMKIKKDNPEISHEEAHEKASEKYNYGKESKEFYDNLRKRRKK